MTRRDDPGNKTRVDSTKQDQSSFLASYLKTGSFCEVPASCHHPEAAHLLG